MTPVTSISIVIATHNRSSLLQRTLDQLRKQAYEPGDEVIVVDNASSDTTPKVIARAADEFPVPLLVLSELNNGKGPALNAGIAAASGSVLALTDDDVLVADDWIATIRRIFQDSSIALVGGRVDPLWEQRAPDWLRVEQDAQDGRYSPLGSPLALQSYGDAQPLGQRTAVGANLAVRRAVCLTVGGIATELAPRRGTLLRAEDHEFCNRVRAAGYRCEYRPELRVRHWVPAERMRLRYFVRWFFWSGVAYAILGDADAFGADGVRRPIPLYFARNFLRASFSALHGYVRGRRVDAAVAATEAAFSLGYVAHCKARWTLGRLPHVRT